MLIKVALYPAPLAVAGAPLETTTEPFVVKFVGGALTNLPGEMLTGFPARGTVSCVPSPNVTTRFAFSGALLPFALGFANVTAMVQLEFPGSAPFLQVLAAGKKPEPCG